MKKTSLALILILFISCLFSYDNYQNTLTKANSAYKNNDFDTALNLYSSLENKIPKNPDLCYNIGNTYFRLNRIGLAILYYKKALLNNSSHFLAKKNLNFAIKFTIDKQDYENQNFISNLIIKAYNYISLNILADFLILALLIFIFLLHKSIRKKSRHPQTLRLLLIISMFIVGGLVVWSSMRYYHYVNNNEAVILSPEVQAYSGPGENYSNLFTIHEGLIIKINKKDNAWTLISLSNGLSGWVRSSTFNVVRND